MKNFLILTLSLLLSTMLPAQDSIFTSGTTKVSFKLSSPTAIYEIKCVRYTASANTTTTPRTISTVGKVLIKKDGTGTFQPSSSTYTGTWTYYKESCPLEVKSIYVGPKPKIIITPPPVDTVPIIITPISSTYTLTTAKYTSAGVYQAGKLVRTLWENELKPAGTYNVSWDKKKLDGSTISGSYEIIVTAHNIKPKWYSNVGNTSKDTAGMKRHRGLRAPYDAVEFNGYLYYVTGFVEGHTACKKAPLTDLSICTEVMPTEHHDVNQEEQYLATDGNYLYHAGIDPYSASKSWVYATNLSDQEVLFSAGSPLSTALGRTYPKAIDIQTNAPPKGMAVGNHLYVSHGTFLSVLNKTTGARVLTITGKFGDICIDGNKLYNLAGDSIVSYTINSNGSLSWLSATYSPGTVGISVKAGEILTTKGQPDFNSYIVRGFVTHGSSGVWYGEPAASRIVRRSGGSITGQIAFIPMNYNLSVDRNNPTRIFAGFAEFSYNYSNNTWQFVKDWSSYFNASYKAPSIADTRNIFSSVITVGTKTYAFIEYWGDDVRSPQLIELTSTGVIFKKTYDPFQKVIIDRNGDILTLTASGAVTREVYNPTTFTWANPITVIPASNPIIGPWSDVTMAEDYSIFNKTYQHTGYHFSKLSPTGPLFFSAPSTTRSYTGAYPTNGTFDIGNGVEYPGGLNYVCDSFTYWNYMGEFWKNSQVNMWQGYYRGLMFLQFGTDGTKVGDGGPWMAGNAMMGQVVKVPGTNKYAVWHCDESYNACLHLWILDYSSLQIFRVRD